MALQDTKLERGFGMKLPVSIFVSSVVTILDYEENGEGDGGWGGARAVRCRRNAPPQKLSIKGKDYGVSCRVSRNLRFHRDSVIVCYGV